MTFLERANNINAKDQFESCIHGCGNLDESSSYPGNHLLLISKWPENKNLGLEQTPNPNRRWSKPI